MAIKKEVYKVYSLLALFFLLIMIVWKTHQQYKGPSGVFKDTAIVDLHYKVLTTAPPENLEKVPKVDPTEDPWESEQIRRKALLAKVCKENAGKTHMVLDPDTDRWRISFVCQIPIVFRFMYDANTNTLWCDIAKCGSTTYVFTVFKELYLKAGFKINVSPKM